MFSLHIPFEQVMKAMVGKFCVINGRKRRWPWKEATM